ncbi:MAG: holo-[acyl-carrier-protein] synthase [Phycisphaerales bacterium]|nr:holo-[acyl-carrier-protein] synthase [Phycisphaerales bacterium]
MHVIGVGIDIIEVSRIARMIEEHGARFLNRVFTPAEQDYANTSPIQRVQRLAARFAAKEAALKALCMGLREGISWTDIECTHRSDGSPTLNVRERAAEIAQGRGIDAWLVSLTHIQHMAAATVTAGRKI